MAEQWYFVSFADRTKNVQLGACLIQATDDPESAKKKIRELGLEPLVSGSVVESRAFAIVDIAGEDIKPHRFYTSAAMKALGY